MKEEIESYNEKQSFGDREICKVLAETINSKLSGATSKIWHAHPVWFLNENPIVGYSKLKDSVRLMFWSGADFDETVLQPGTGKFKDASIRYTSVDQIDLGILEKLLIKARQIQYDYKNLVKRKGILEKMN